MLVRIAYGQNEIDVPIPESHAVDILEKRPVPPIADPDAQLRAGLEAPTDCAPLRELARGRRDAIIVVSDLTRPVPNATLLPPILAALRAGGLPTEAVTILVATGLHRPNTPAELDRMLGSKLARSLRVE